jgi:hypothetical protein
MHPKLGMQRRLNFILYLASGWKYAYGGHLGLWSNDLEQNHPSKLEKEVPIGFNSALIFDTTQHSWQGISRMVKAPAGLFTKKPGSIFNYVCLQLMLLVIQGPHRHLLKSKNKDAEILEIIKKRVDVNASTEV